MHADCAEAVTQVWDYLDGRLPDDASASLIAHVAVCPPCLAFQLHHERCRAALGGLRVKRKAPLHLRHRVFNALWDDGFQPMHS